MIKATCRCCNSKYLKSTIPLGLSPLANNLLNNINEKDELYPLDVMFCETCTNSQLSFSVSPEKLFNTYLYVSSTAKSFRDHFENASKDYIDEFNLNKDSVVVDIGSNDGIGLSYFKSLGMNVIGIEPASNIAKLANEKGIETINSYFDEHAVKKILTRFSYADLVTASNVFAHSNEIKSITENVFKLLKDDGCFIIEVQYLLDTIKDLTFDNIYHEHVNYWSVTSLNNFFNSLGLSVTNVKHIDTHGGSIRVYVKRIGSIIDKSVNKFLDEEKKFGILDKKTYDNFFLRIEEAKKNVINNLKLLKQKGLKIVGYGAPAKATTLLNYFEIGTEYIDYIVEDNNLKHGKLIPGVKIPIYSKDVLESQRPDIIVVMAWNFFDEIKKNNQKLIDLGIKFISIKQLQEQTI